MNKFLILITSIVFLLTSITYSKTSDLIVFGQNSGNDSTRSWANKYNNIASNYIDTIVFGGSSAAKTNGTVYIPTDYLATTAEVSSTYLPLTNSLTRNVFYVDMSNGSDSNAGSMSSPWQTIAHANTNATFGTTVVVMPGTYTDKMTNSGPVWHITKGATVYSALPGTELYESIIKGEGKVFLTSPNPYPKTSFNLINNLRVTASEVDVYPTGLRMTWRTNYYSEVVEINADRILRLPRLVGTTTPSNLLVKAIAKESAINIEIQSYGRYWIEAPYIMTVDSTYTNSLTYFYMKAKEYMITNTNTLNYANVVFDGGIIKRESVGSLDFNSMKIIGSPIIDSSTITNLSADVSGSYTYTNAPIFKFTE